VPPRIARSPKALRDIKGEWAYLFAEGGAKVADHFLEAVEQTITLLSETPLVGSLRHSTQRAPKEYRKFAVRSPFGNWAILYLPTSRGITVLRVLHGSRHPNALLP